MTIHIEFESMIVCRDIIEQRVRGGWNYWLENFSMEDDGELSRISAMSGYDIARSEKRAIRQGLNPPIIDSESYSYTDYFIYAFEYQPHKALGLAVKSPNWLIWNDPLIYHMSISEIEKLPVEDQCNPWRPTFDFNKGRS